MGNSSHLHPVPEPQENIENRAIGILQREAEAFACATQVPCRAVDSRGNFIGGDSIESSCRLCFQSADSGESAISTCASVLKEGIRQSERFGGAYMSFCPDSLLITVAIVRNEAMSVGALVMGPALLVDREELITEELARNTDSDQASFGRMTNILETMPSLDTKRAKALADMLENAASHCSDNFEGRLDPKIE
ncbi:MAG: PocR ligand-binding domain-containing protein, partial [Spirochaetaceae bacterium]|nr:PocR ligand-binding domain-containing protein [Spirochaetaceae bacterium]